MPGEPTTPKERYPSQAADLRVLIVEDLVSDAELMVAVLKRAGFSFDWRRVETEEAFREALSERPDIILADYSLPRFDALGALRVLHASEFDIPFIVVTGRMEDKAVECMKQGAVDYLLKDRLGRLGAAVGRALEEHRLQRLARAAQDGLRKSEERFRRLAENAPDVVYWWRLAPAFVIEYVSPAIADVTGYPPGAFYVDPGLLWDLVHPEDREALEQAASTAAPALLTVRMTAKDGRTSRVQFNDQPVLDDSGRAVAREGVARDVTLAHETDQRKADLVAAMAHELRGPISALSEIAALLGSEDTQRDPEKLRDSAARIQARVADIQRIVDEQLA